MDELEKHDPMIGEHIQFGFDGRTSFFAAEEPRRNTFIQMQGDLYVTTELSPEFRVHFSKGLYEDFELMTIAHVLPAHGFVKVGRFTPPYGLRLADHTAFVRDRQGFDVRWRETGIEIGFHPERWSAAIALTNGNREVVDNDERKAATGRADVRLRVGDLRTLLGGTGRWRGSETGDDEWTGGGYAGLALGPVSVLSEVGLRSRGVGALTSFVEFAVLVTRGVTLRVAHDYQDPDVDLQTGHDERFVGGVEWVPVGALQILANARVDRERRGLPEGVEADLQLHVFY